MSLFNNDSCCGGDTAGKTREKSKCSGCVCEILDQLANHRFKGNLCTMGGQQRVRLVLKGADEGLDVTGGGGPATDFTIVSFDPRTCCLVVTHEEGNDTLTSVFDCRCICGIICVPNGKGGSGGSVLG
ncbi:hypothetical protein [Fictibacillus barbaricus]|uniref:Spore coat protein n=1 Tax=Fictibacillus barbaricus TaxID=182136 RepID=A0ABS2ZH71_9BACL|nr:hypothetical protein [Fictibacillus barbaricus]MBN3546080.1 hypothetical protein [Fictibacillus barbaricus]GGB58476.1 hypothetical protein GCM10007199_25430 [Fictibacillus barbaricus]